MRRTSDVGMFLEGLFLGIACLIVYLVFQDARNREGWSGKELALFGVALGLALGGFWVETTL